MSAPGPWSTVLSIESCGLTAGVGEVEAEDAGDALVDAVVAGLLRMGVIPSADYVRCTKVLRIPLGYPVQTHSRSEIVAMARNWLGEHNIYTLGRFGEWAYVNSDEALYRGHCL